MTSERNTTGNSSPDLNPTPAPTPAVTTTKGNGADPAGLPDDTSDIARLFDTTLGDTLTNGKFVSIAIGKPKDFFRTHPDPAYRPRAEVYAHKPEGVIDVQYYIVDPKMKGLMAGEARPCLMVTVVYRDGSPRLWPIMLPRDGEHDNDAWSSARSVAKIGLTSWVKLRWLRRAYVPREAQPGYAPDPDWTKVPPFEQLVRTALGEHGVIKSEDHPIYRDLIGDKPDADAGL
jgi:hypothetical protein